MVPPTHGNDSEGVVFGGEPFGPLVVALKDAAFRTTMAGTGQQVSVRVIGCSEPICTLVGTSKVISIDGEATFTSLAVTYAATGYYLRFTVDRYCSQFACIGGWSLYAESRRFDVHVGKFAQLKLLEFPSIGVEGRDFVPSPRVAATDAGGNQITQSSFDVHARQGSGGFGDLLSRNNIFFRAAVGGVVTFDGLFFDLPSTYDVVFNATFDNISASVTMERLRVTGREHTAMQQGDSQPLLRQTAYAPVFPQPVVQLQDIFSALVLGSTYAVTAQMAPPQYLQGVRVVGSSVVPVILGIATFTNIAVTNAGVGFSIVFSVAGGVNSATSNLFTVEPGLAIALSVTVQPHNETAGRVLQPYPVAVQVDIGGNVVQKSAPLRISLLQDQIASFQKTGSDAPELKTYGSGLVVDTVNGTAVFRRLHIEVAGSYRLEFTRLENTISSMTTQSQTFSISPGHPIGLYMQTEPGVGVTGFELKPFPVVAFQDLFGNFVPNVPKNPAVKAFLVENTGNSTLLCGGRFPCVRISVEGQILFDGLGVNNIGKGYIIEFEALLEAENTGLDLVVRVQSGSFDVSGLEGAAVVTAQPQNGQCEKPLPGVTSVALQDQFGNFAAAAADLVTVAIRPVVKQAGRQPAITGESQVQSVSGVAHFSDLRVDMAGDYVLMFTFGLMDTITESQQFLVSAGEPRLVKLSELPLIVTAGVAFSPVLTVIDACANAAIGYPANVTVELSSSPPSLVVERGAKLLSPLEFTEISGSGFLNMTIDIHGSSYLLIVRVSFPLFPELSSLYVVSINFTVAVGELHHLQLDGLSASGVANEVLGPPAHVSARDLGNNIVPLFAAVVRARRLRGSIATSLLEGDIYVQADNGIAVFKSLKISQKDPSIVIEFQYQADFNVPLDVNMLRVQSQEIEITGAVRTMRVYQAIEGALGGDPFLVQPVLAVFDAGGVIVPSYLFTVTARVLDGSGDELEGTQTIPFVDGIATFTDLALMTHGARAVEFVSKEDDTSFVAQQSFTVSIGPAVKIVLLTQPTDFFAYQPFATTVLIAAQDRGSNTVLDIFEVNARVQANRQSSPLLGVTKRSTINGRASFPGLKIDAVGTGFTVLFEATRNDQTLSVISAQFSLKGKLGGVVVTQFPSGGIAFQVLRPPVVLQTVDEAYNLTPLQESLSCVIALVDMPAGAGITLDSTKSVGMVGGVATFSALKLDTKGSGSCAFICVSCRWRLLRLDMKGSGSCAFICVT